MIVSSQMQLFDLKSFLPIGHNSATSRKEIAYREYRQNHFFSNHGFCSIVSFSAMRCSLPRKLQSDYVHLLGSVSLHGLRSTHLSRKPQGHRGMSSRGEAEAISYGHQEQRITKYSGPCQREPRLENLCRLCPSADQDRQRIIRERRLRLGIKTGRLRLRFNDYRSLPFGISLGQVPQNQSRSEASHLVGSPGQHPRCDQYYQRQNSRCQRARRSCLRAWSHLYFRQGICRLRPALPDSSITRVFCNARKKQFRFQASLLTASGQVNRDTGRPDHYGHRFLHAAGLSRETQANPILRYRHKEALCFSDQQLHATSNRDREALQMPLESGVVLQMDQTTPAYQVVLRHQRECVKDTNMDCHFCIRSRGHCQEAIEARSEPLHNSTNIECDHVRENAHFAGSFFTKLRNRYH